MKSTDPSVYVVILNFNHLDELKLTLNSFNNQDYSNLKLLISDNGSADNSIEWVKENYPEVILLKNDKNLGWSGGNNVGIKYALSEKADYILLSNNDIVIDNKSLITRLVEDLQTLTDNQVHLLGTKVNYFPDKSKTHNTGWIMYPKAEKKAYYFNEYRSKIKNNLGDEYCYVDSADGCFFLIDSVVFRNIGLFNEDLFMYADEIEFSLRAWENGYRSAVNKTLTIFHKVGTSSIPNSPFSNYYRYRNLLFLIKKTRLKNYFLRVYFKDIIKMSFKLLFSQQNDISKKLQIFIAIFKGIKDGIFNNMGMRFMPKSK